MIAMNRIDVLCDPDLCRDSGMWHGDVFRTFGPSRQLFVEKDAYARHPNRRIQDLVAIAATVYGLDGSYGRGTDIDLFGDNWRRQFFVTLPVQDIEFWSAQAVRDGLEQTLDFLTGDSWHFEFTLGRRRLPQTQLEFVGDNSSEDVVVLFSGGVDSLGAVIRALEQGLNPVIVSHYSNNAMHGVQQDLLDQLSACYRPLPVEATFVHRRGRRAIEYTFRSRAFLFLALATAAAQERSIEEIHIGDNGIVSINLSPSGAQYGAYLSRSTHPQFLAYYEDFVQHLVPGLRIRNPLFQFTKKEVMELIAEAGHPELIQMTWSCAHPEGRSKMLRHCGLCTQCIDRRFASAGGALRALALVSKPTTYLSDM